MDEDSQVPAENENVAEDSNVTTSPVEEPNTSEPNETDGETEQAPVSEPVAEDTQTESDRKPTRAERRIRQLSDKVKELEGSSRSIPSYVQPPQVQVEPGAEYTQEDYQQHVAQAAQGVALPEIERLRTEFETKEATRNFDYDLELVSKEPELDDTGGNFIPELEQAITDEYQEKAFKVAGVDPVSGQVRYKVDPSVRLADITKKHLNVARAAARKSSAATQAAVAESADTNAIKPSGEVRQDKPISEMSIEELEAKVGYHNG